MCANDLSLRRELEALREAHDLAGRFMERGALDIPENYASARAARIALRSRK
jgi:hypothetical protein